MIQRADPLTNRKCNNTEECMVCKNDTIGRGQCRREGVTYTIKCSECAYVYHGETARNAYTRGLEHMSALRKQDKDSVLHRHTKEHHNNVNNVTPRYDMRVTGTHTSALDRQVTEAVTIGNTPRSLLMNSKQEYGHNRLVRAILTAE